MAKRVPKPESNHVHKLQRHTYPNGTKIYFCILNCDYKIEAQFALGKETICHRCNQGFVMNEHSTRLARPHCKDCGKVKVIGEDGKAVFQPRPRPSKTVLTDVGKGSVVSLRDRLSRVVQISKDEDI